MERIATYKWALVRYNSTNEAGKKAVDLANSGIGYHIMNKSRSKGEDVILAFKFVPVGADGMPRSLPDHAEFASNTQADKLEDWDFSRKGKQKTEDRRSMKASPITDIFPGAKQVAINR